MHRRTILFSICLSAAVALWPLAALADEGHGHSEGGIVAFASPLAASFLAALVVGALYMSPSLTLNTLQLWIVGLGMITAVIHFFAGSGGELLLLLNAAGYIALLTALVVAAKRHARFRPLVLVALFIYTLVTFIGYFALHAVSEYDALALFTKFVELGLLIVLGVRLLQLRKR